MPLNLRQIEAIPVLDWLLDTGDENRRGGRTTAFAIGIIRAACRTPGRSVPLVDHYATTREQQEMLFHVVEALVRQDDNLAPYATWPNVRRYLQLALPRPLANWMPPASWFGPMPAPPIVGLPSLASPVPEPEPYRPTVWERLMTQLL